jgi:uncharacterized protein (DUF1810 family)
MGAEVPKPDDPLDSAGRVNRGAGKVAGSSASGHEGLGSGGPDAYDLARFVHAQENVYERALEELRAGRKRSHWIWFIFPQLAGLGSSAMSRRYAIRNIEEAGEYLRHPVLGPRLVECTEAVSALDGRSARQIFGTPDDKKLCSSMTLFELVSAPGSVFAAVLEKYFSGERDARTIDMVRPTSEGGR